MKIAVRNGGTKCFTSEAPLDKVEACRQICADQQFAKVDGVTVDLYSASVLVKVFDALNDNNKAVILKRDIAGMVAVAFRVLA